MPRACVAFFVAILTLSATIQAADMGRFHYKDFKKPNYCGRCHREVFHHNETETTITVE